MCFQSICREHVRHRRAKLAKFVADAFVFVFAPDELTNEDTSESQREACINRFNMLSRTPITSSASSAPPSDSSVKQGSHLSINLTSKTRVACVGDTCEWTKCQLYLCFLQQVLSRIPGISIDIIKTKDLGRSEPKRPEEVYVGSQELEAWLQMTVSISFPVNIVIISLH